MPPTRILLLLLLISLAAGAQTVKFAAYNIYFLVEDISPQRKANLQEVLQKLNADVIAFEEIDNPAALRNILPQGYQIAMIDDPREVQEVALAARPPFVIRDYHYVFPGAQYDEEFPRSRDLLQVEVEGYGQSFFFLVVHAKSRRGGRINNDYRRETAARRIVDYVRSQLTGRNVVLLGDFNDNPDDRSLNILETGNPEAAGGPDKEEDSFLYNTSEPLLEKDYCSYGYNYLYPDTVMETFDPVVPGSREENNRWRGKEYDFFKDVKIKETLLDQILVSMNLKPWVTKAGVFNDGAAIRGDDSRIQFRDDQLVYLHQGALASDHVPVWVELTLPAGQ